MLAMHCAFIPVCSIQQQTFTFTFMAFNITSTEAALTDLRPHPENQRIYSEKKLTDDFLESIRNGGIREALAVTKDGLIVSGHRRFRACQQLGFTSVPITVVPYEDDAEILSALLDFNKQRVKTNREVAAEAELYMQIETKLAARRRASANSKDVLAKCPDHVFGTARDNVGKKLRMCGKTAEKAAKAAKASDALKAAGKTAEAAEIDAAINKGFDTGYKLAIQKGYIPAPKEKPKEKEEHSAEPPAEPARELPADINVSGNQSADLTCDVAIDLAEEILAFLEGVGAQEMSTEQKNHWSKLLDGFEEVRQTLAI